MRYKIDTYGRVYRSNGPTHGWKGSIGGLTADNVLSQIKWHEKRKEGILITRESDGITVQAQNFVAGMR